MFVGWGKLVKPPEFGMETSSEVLHEKLKMEMGRRD
jgi:hypothetical protein